MKLSQSIWPVAAVLLILGPAILFLQQVIENSANEQLHVLTKIQNQLSKNVETAVDTSTLNTARCVSTKGTKQCWRDLKRAAWLETLDAIEKMPEPDLAKFRNPIKNWDAFDLITTTHECDLNYFSRVPRDGDGGKWICGPLAVGDDCVLFSLGSNGNFAFEQSMKTFTQDKCKIYTFDCTGSWSDPSTNFYPWCIANRDYKDDSGRIYKRISTIFEELKLKQISHLKMDIEGYEWQVFQDILNSENKLALPKQISFELHFVDWVVSGINPANWVKPLVSLLKQIDGAGYRFAAIENNVLCEICAEYVIVREDVL